jgi:hypothetical protein
LARIALAISVWQPMASMVASAPSSSSDQAPSALTGGRSMARFIVSNLFDLLTDSLRYIVLMLVLVWLVVIAASIGV